MKLFTLLLLLCVVTVHAQTDPLRDKLNNVFANVNKTEITTGFLAEFGAPLISLHPFNGLLTDSNKVTAPVWRHVYGTIQSSRIQGTNPLASLATVNSTIASAESAANGAIPVAVLFSEYNRIRPDALNLNLFTIQNNQLFDVLDDNYLRTSPRQHLWLPRLLGTLIMAVHP